MAMWKIVMRKEQSNWYSSEKLHGAAKSGEKKKERKKKHEMDYSTSVMAINI